jgi:hypothetical protein
MSIGAFKKLKRPFRSRWPVVRSVRDDDWPTYTLKMFPRNICRQHFALAFNLDAFHLQSRKGSLTPFVSSDVRILAPFNFASISRYRDSCNRPSTAQSRPGKIAQFDWPIRHSILYVPACSASRRRCSAGPAAGMRAAFDLRAARPRGRKARFRRAIEIEGGPRLVMSYAARVFISSPQEKARRLLDAAEPVSAR